MIPWLALHLCPPLPSRVQETLPLLSFNLEEGEFVGEEVESDSLQQVSKSPRPYTLDFSASGMEGEAAASCHPSGGSRRCSPLRPALPGERRRPGQRPQSPESLAEGGQCRPERVPLPPRPASRHFSQDFAHPLSRSPEMRPRGRQKGQKASPGGLSSWDGGPSAPAPPGPPFPASGRQPRAAPRGGAPGTAASAGVPRPEAPE